MARRNDHTKEQIQSMALAAAIQMLNEEGMSGLSTRKVAKAIGYTVGTLYLVFRNLDELILQVNAATLDDLHQTIMDEAKMHSDPNQALKAMAVAYLDYAQQYNARWSLLFSHQLPDGNPIPEWFDNKIANIFAGVKVLLQQIKPDLHEQALLQATRELWSGVHGACDLALNGKLSVGGEFQAKPLIESLVDNYLRGFAKG